MFLPDGSALVTGEKKLVSDSFTPSILGVLLSTQLTLTNRRLVGVRPNSIFGLFPAGSQKMTFPVERIAGITVSSGYDFIPGCLGLIVFLLIGLPATVGVVASVGSMNIGASLTLLSFAVVSILFACALLAIVPRQAIWVTNSGGGAIAFPVSIFEKSAAMAFVQKLNNALMETTGGGKLAPNEPTAAATSRPDASTRLRELRSMLDAGLITEAEYDAKRTKILEGI